MRATIYLRSKGVRCKVYSINKKKKKIAIIINIKC